MSAHSCGSPATCSPAGSAPCLLAVLPRRSRHRCRPATPSATRRWTASRTHAAGGAFPPTASILLGTDAGRARAARCASTSGSGRGRLRGARAARSPSICRRTTSSRSACAARRRRTTSSSSSSTRPVRTSGGPCGATSTSRASGRPGHDQEAADPVRVGTVGRRRAPPRGRASSSWSRRAAAGAGTVWIDDLELRRCRRREQTPPPLVASASSARRGGGPRRAVDGDSTHRLGRAGPATASRGSTLDLGSEREFGGLVLDWVPGRHALDYVVETSDDGAAGACCARWRGGNGGPRSLCLPETEARALRLRVSRAARWCRGLAIARDVACEPLAWGATPRGLLPRGGAGGAPRGCLPARHPRRAGVLDGGGRRRRRRGRRCSPRTGRSRPGKARSRSSRSCPLDGRLLTGPTCSRGAVARRTASLPIPRVTWRAGDST